MKSEIQIFTEDRISYDYYISIYAEFCPVRPNFKKRMKKSEIRSLQIDPFDGQSSGQKSVRDKNIHANESTWKNIYIYGGCKSNISVNDFKFHI